jgi:hypothetical protein
MDAAEQYCPDAGGVRHAGLESGGHQQAGTDIDTLYAKLREYSIASANNDTLGMGKALEDMNT